MVKAEHNYGPEVSGGAGPQADLELSLEIERRRSSSLEPWDLAHFLKKFFFKIFIARISLPDSDLK